ncbi:hypothetical protein [Chimaeribacter coloradensis]|uniref:hypothetical protein n=1 Tax=Chimaeribacter coloradensis TaxID=2060068 RepID=UPI0011AF31D2|nr:hypothetical protein [Chimaeribacter coloradensis]
MKISCHLHKRMSERNISYDVINLIMSLGDFSKNGERIILNKDTIDIAIKHTDELKKRLTNIREKNGGTLVLANDALITSFFHYGKNHAKNNQRKNKEKHKRKHYCHTSSAPES